MKIRNKLSLLFTLLTAAILLGFASLIYFSAAHSRESEFYKSLQKEGVTKANLFFKAKVDAATLQTIYLNNREIVNEVETAIYDTSFRLLYHDAAAIDVVKESPQMLAEVSNRQVIRFYQSNLQVVGLTYFYKGSKYIVIAAAYDQYGYSKLRSLGKNMLMVLVFALAIIYIAGRFFSAKALAPIVEMNVRTREISATNLHLRVASKGRDELAELAATFNQMLERLEKSFEAQKDFVSNTAHELRTPLAAMIAELQLSGHKERSSAEYEAVIRNVLLDSQKLAKLTNSLLDFAKASYDPSVIAFKEVRLDEVLMDARNQVMGYDPAYRVSLSYEGNTEDEMLLNGNEYLLRTAFINLAENACKFSADRHCAITIRHVGSQALVAFEDRGLGIAEEDLEAIFVPFFRGYNKSAASGNGIGLSLARKIVELHGGSIGVRSERGSGSVFTLSLPLA